MHCQSMLQGGEKFNLTLNEQDKVLPTVFFGRLPSFNFFTLLIFFFNAFVGGFCAESENMKKIFVRH